MATIEIVQRQDRGWGKRVQCRMGLKEKTRQIKTKKKVNRNRVGGRKDGMSVEEAETRNRTKSFFSDRHWNLRW